MHFGREYEGRRFSQRVSKGTQFLWRWIPKEAGPSLVGESRGGEASFGARDHPTWNMYGAANAKHTEGAVPWGSLAPETFRFPTRDRAVRLGRHFRMKRVMTEGNSLRIRKIWKGYFGVFGSSETFPYPRRCKASASIGLNISCSSTVSGLTDLRSIEMRSVVIS